MTEGTIKRAVIDILRNYVYFYMATSLNRAIYTICDIGGIGAIPLYLVPIIHAFPSYIYNILSHTYHITFL